MAKSKTVLVAAQQIHGGTADKKGPFKRFVLAAGEELTASAQQLLGLDADGVAALLQERRALREVEIRAADQDASADSGAVAAEARAAAAESRLAAETKRADEAEAQMAEQTKRADEAEAKVAELTQQLEDATKPKE
jgi:hypothetical protein